MDATDSLDEQLYATLTVKRASDIDPLWCDASVRPNKGNKRV